MGSSKRRASSAARAFTVTMAGALLLGCSDEGGDDAGEDGAPVAANPDEYLASFVSVVSAPDATIIELPEPDPTVTLVSLPAEFLPFVPAVPLEPGGTVSVSVAYEDENANVVAGGIGFTSAGPILRVPIADVGGTSGSVSIEVGLPGDLCQHIGSECRSVTAYTYAITSEGRVSAPLVVDMATACGPCTAPGCAGLLPECPVASP
jgi:hypothetical protein